MSTRGKTVLFQGDSITDAGRPRQAEHDPTPANPFPPYLGHGYANLIAARLGFQLAESGHRFANRGLGGNRVSDLYARWNEDAFSLKPDLISILIGVNDAWRIVNRLPQGATNRFERAYRHLLEETKEVLPGTGLVLCEPFILKGTHTEESWEELRGLTDSYGQIVRALAAEYDAVFVALQEPFDRALERAEASFWIHDGIHPSAAGHELIAAQWLKAVQESRLALT
ncbi:SGNH/GDSL hydrolase family protein [Paenibacillus sp. PL2-23]|uniref:SGNH/GDSL hydrolase family protein n=1 Tax=Paenibacillus sp. PL2-23 TaxID=2100729 RepID=UPI0030F5B42B